jgi:hypothetical protein
MMSVDMADIDTPSTGNILASGEAIVLKIELALPKVDSISVQLTIL